MNADIMAEWLGRLGHRIVRTASSYWYDKGPRAFQAFPWCRTIDPPPEELRELFFRHCAIGARYSAPPSAPEGFLSYHAVCGARDYDLLTLPRQTRQNIERGLARCRVEPVSFERMAVEGWRLQTETLARQHRRDGQSREQWERYCREAGALPGFEAWGAFVGTALASTIMLVRIDEWVVMLCQQCASEHLPARANHALVYTVTRELLRRPETAAILYTIHSLDAPDSVDTFKFRIGYAPMLVKQRAVFHPVLTPFVRPGTLSAVRLVLRGMPGNPYLAKAAGLMRTFLEGRKPVAVQDLPAVLREREVTA